MSDNRDRLPDVYYAEDDNIVDRSEEESEDESAAKDRMVLPERGSRSILSAVIAFVLGLASIPCALYPIAGYALAVLSLGFVGLFRLKFGFFIKMTLLAMIFAMMGLTVSTFVVVFRALLG